MRVEVWTALKSGEVEKEDTVKCTRTTVKCTRSSAKPINVLFTSSKNCV